MKLSNLNFTHQIDWKWCIISVRMNVKFDDLMWNCYCVWLLFFFLTNDVSTFQKDDYCKNQSMNELIDSEKHENRLLIECRKFEKKNRQLIRMSFKQTDWLIDFEQKNLQLSRFVDLKMFYVNFIQFTKIRFVISWFFQKTWIENQMKYIYRFQKKKFTHWRFSFDSRIFTNDLKFSNRRFSFDSRIFTNDLKFSNRRFFLIIRVFLRTYLTILFNYSRISTSNSQKQNLIE